MLALLREKLILMHMERKLLHIGVVLLGTLTGCTFVQTGQLPVQERLDMVAVGDSANKVGRLLGPPVFEEKTAVHHFMLYARTLTKHRGCLPDEQTQRDVYVFTFDKKDRLIEKTHLTLADGHKVAFDSATTPTRRQDDSFWQEVVQNFGRYDTGDHDSIAR